MPFQNKMFIFLLLFFTCITYSMHFRRPTRVPASRQAPQNMPWRARTSQPSRQSYSQSRTLKNLNKKIKQCQISEEEYSDIYRVWDQIVTECAWKGKCIAGGECIKESNCLLNGQIAYLAWQASQKETDAHLIEQNVLTYDKNKC